MMDRNEANIEGLCPCILLQSGML